MNVCLYSIAYIDNLYAFIIEAMDTIVRTTRQLGSSLRRIRRQKKLAQDGLAELMHVRQATVSKLEAGAPATPNYAS